MADTNLKILLVDDEPDILEFLKYNLQKEGYKVFVAPNGKLGIEIASKEKPDLIILDIMMPEMDGIETCRLMREIPDFKDTMIVFLTARNEDYSQIAGFGVGADDYITKPVKPRVLLSRISALFRRYKGRNGAVEQNENVFVAGDLKIDREQYIVSKGNEKLELVADLHQLQALRPAFDDLVESERYGFTEIMATLKYGAVLAKSTCVMCSNLCAFGNRFARSFRYIDDL